MAKYFQRLFISISFIIYAISALEINACGIENTFSDQYDVYIEGKLQKIESIVDKENKKDHDKQQLEKQYFTVTSHQYLHPFLITSAYQKRDGFVQIRTLWQRKLFVLHSSFLI